MPKGKKKPPRQSRNNSRDIAASERAIIAEAHQESFSGPLPPPFMLAQYNEIIPNGAERLLAMVERQEEHRQRLERTVVNGDTKRSYIGLAAGFIVAVSFLGASVFLAMNGHEVAAVTIAGIDIGGVVAIFVVGTISRRGERTEKARLMSRVRR